jgi:hypothetical protein
MNSASAEMSFAKAIISNASLIMNVCFQIPFHSMPVRAFLFAGVCYFVPFIFR